MKRGSKYSDRLQPEVWFSFWHVSLPADFQRISGLLIVSCLLLVGCTMPLVWEDVQPPPISQTSPSTPIDLGTPPKPTDTGFQPATNSPVSPTEVLPSPTPQPSPQPSATPPPYVLQPGAPAASKNFAHPELGCDWMGVAGQVLDQNREPAMGLLIEVGGDLPSQQVRSLAMTGTAPLYGPGGFEITISDHPLASEASLWIQVYDISGLPASARVYFDTFEECEHNLVLINFIEMPPMDYHIFLPSLSTHS
jgi:hypothetical protein